MSDDDLGKLFRSLPDEDPPDGGMAALLAAARDKARDMAPPPKASLWARFADTFKRPPVLAFATIVVLIGGALIVKGHGDAMDVPAMTVATPQAATPPPVIADPTPAPVVAAVVPEPPPIERTPEPPRATPMAPRPPAPHRAPPAAIVEQKLDEGAATGGMAEDTTRTPPTATPGPRPAIEPKLNAPAGMAIATEDVAKSPPPVSAEQLLHQCHSAAARGDCPAVRTIANRIQTSNAAFYRDRVVKDAAIAKCLP